MASKRRRAVGDDPKLRKQCGDKTRYARLEWAQARGQKFGQRAYLCRVCGGWHLTSHQ